MNFLVYIPTDVLINRTVYQSHCSLYFICYQKEGRQRGTWNSKKADGDFYKMIVSPPSHCCCKGISCYGTVLMYEDNTSDFYACAFFVIVWVARVAEMLREYFLNIV